MWREGASWGHDKGNLATAQQEATFPTIAALSVKGLPSPSLPQAMKRQGSHHAHAGEGGGYLAFDWR